MSLTIESLSVPLRIDSDGVARVGGTRVTLETVIRTFLNGATAEEICQRYPAVTLLDVYSVITFFLQHSKEVKAYLHERERLSAEVRSDIEKRFGQQGIRERLLARRKP